MENFGIMELPSGEPLVVAIRVLGYPDGRTSPAGGPYMVESNVGLSMTVSAHREDFWLRNVTECCGVRSYNSVQGAHRNLHRCLTCFAPTAPGFDLSLKHTATRGFVAGQVRHDPVATNIIVDALLGTLENLWEDHEKVLRGRQSFLVFGPEVR